MKMADNSKMDKKYTFQPDDAYGSVFAIVNILDKTYVCPGWHPVPSGTTRDQIEFDISKQPSKSQSSTRVKSEPKLEWQVDGSKGNKYTVSKHGEDRNCTCPAKSFRRGDCKHIKLIKEQQLLN